jgi:hypothetical protein
MNRTRLSKAIKEKFGIPGKFTSEKEEINFYRKMDGNTKIEILEEMRREYMIKKFGYIPKMERVVKIRKLRKHKK